MKNKLCGAFLLAVAVLHCVLGDYELKVRLHEYNNPTSKLESNGALICCDVEVLVDVCVGGDRCDNYFVSCFREIGSDGPCISDQLALTSPSFENTSSVNFATNGSINSSVIASSPLNGTNIKFNASSSILLLQRTGAWEGVQLFINSMDSDDDGMTFNLQLVDNFTIDLNTSFLIPGAGFTARTVYKGTFDFAYLDLSFRVSCAVNFFGSNCARECIPLNNHTTCDEDGTLVCLPGFTGTNCMTNIDDCSNNDACGPNEQCVDGIGTFNCQCSPGFTGANCTTNIDDCTNNNACGPNGQCVDGIGTFNCQCSPGFTGERCETEIDECQGFDCSGNGQCIDELASFSCDCDPGFTGGRCETNINDCANANCSENSRCVDGVNSFTCVCSAGFTGTFCENQLPPEVDSQGNTYAIIGGAVGAVIGAIALVLILALVLVIVTKKRKSRLKKSGSSKDVPPRDNPTYATATTSTAPPNGTSADDPERVFDNPIYGVPGFDTGDTEDRLYTQPRTV